MSAESSPLAKLQGFFARSEVPGTGNLLTVEKYRQMLERALAESFTGQNLLRFAAQQRVPVHVLPGKGTSGYIPENRAVYMTLPVGLSTVPPMDVLLLGAYFRQAELQFLGAKNPDNSMSSEEFAIAFDSKMIDSIAIMCKIASELKDKGHTEFVDALHSSGHGELYEAYSQYGQSEELVDVYYRLIEKTN